jgi:hypothetical protein
MQKIVRSSQSPIKFYKTVRHQIWADTVHQSDRFCGLVVRVPAYRTEMYCVSCEIRTELMYVMQKKVDCLCVLVVRVPGYRSRDPGSISGATTIAEK